MITDPISDMLTRIRNAISKKHEFVRIPSSKFKLQIAKILEEEGFISSFDMVDQDKFKFININLKYNDRKVSVIKEIKRVSKPGLRVYVNKNEIPRVRGGLGTSIISTSKWVMSWKKARAIGVGGEVLCKIV